ncbi:MAG: hypothetical protein JO222_13285 [Frankiales bacterium]|nr:hypothetical protein [Frankiales bacterium]
MPEYAVLIYGDEAAIAKGGDELESQIMKGHMAFAESNGEKLRGGHALQSVSTATTVRSGADGALTVTDGPFAETKEALGGFYMVEAADLDEAIAIAKQVPAPHGAIEVRPVRVFD